MIQLTTAQFFALIYGSMAFGGLIAFLATAWYYEVGPFIRIPEPEPEAPKAKAEPARRW